MTNPNSESTEAQGDIVQPEAAATEAAATDKPESAAHAAAEVLPSPSAPKLSTTFDPDNIVNSDYLEEEGLSDGMSAAEMLALINQYEETLTDIQ